MNAARHWLLRSGERPAAPRFSPNYSKVARGHDVAQSRQLREGELNTCDRS